MAVVQTYVCHLCKSRIVGKGGREGGRRGGVVCHQAWPSEVGVAGFAV